MSDDFSPWWLLLSFAIRVAWGMGTSAKAADKGRSPVLGFFCGFFLGLIGYLIFHFMSDASGGSSSSDDAPTRSLQSGSEARRSQFEATVQPGSCRVCGYVNGPRENRCYQCGNTMA